MSVWTKTGQLPATIVPDISVAALLTGPTLSQAAVDARFRALIGPLVGFNVKDYGAKGDGVTDDTAAIQATFDATRSAIVAGVSGARVVFPPGEYLVSDTILGLKFSGALTGQGIGNPPNYTASRGNGTVIRWTGSNTKSVFKFRDYAGIDVTGIRFEGNDTTSPTAIIESNWLTGDGAGTGAQLRVERCAIGKSVWSTQGTSKGAATVGVLFSGDNGNNDQFLIRDSQFLGCATAVSVPNTQSTWGMMENCIISGSTIGVKTSASMLLINPQFDNCTTDIQANSTAAVTVMGWGSERSGKLIDLTNIGRVTVYGGKWLLGSPMTGSSDHFIDAPFLTGNAGIYLYDLNISNTLGTHPKLYARGSGGGGVNGGFLVVRNCITTMTVSDLDVASTSNNALEIDIRSSNLLVRDKFTTATTLTTAGDKFLDAKMDKSNAVFNVKNYGAKGDGTTNDRAAIIACFVAAEAAGPGRVVYFPAGVYDTVTGLSLSGYSVQLRGDGAAGSASAPYSGVGSTVIKASAQTGPVIDYTGYRVPGNMMGKTNHGGFHVQGSGVADPTKNNSGVRLTKMGSAYFHDICVRDTGGPCWEHMSSPGDAVYLCDFERLVFTTPVGAKANDVPYFIANESNGSHFRDFGFRSISASADTGVSGAAILDSNASFPGYYQKVDGWWFEFLHPPTGGTLISVRGNQNTITDIQFHDCTKEAGATGTSYFRLLPPAIADQGGNLIEGVIPGAQTAVMDMGVDVQQSRNRIVGVKGYKGNNVQLASGVTHTFIDLGGSQAEATDAAVTDNSGLTTNSWIDRINETEVRGSAYKLTKGTTGNNGPRFSNSDGTAGGSVEVGTTGGRMFVTTAGAMHVRVAAPQTIQFGTDATPDVLFLQTQAGPAVTGKGQTASYPDLKASRGWLQLNATDVRAGTGSPEGVVTAAVGSIWLRTDGASGTMAYTKVTGTGNTGWASMPDSAALGPRHRVWTTGRYYGVEGPHIPGTIANGDGLMTAVPFYVHVNNTITAIGGEITTVGAAGIVRFGIYGSNANDQPSGAPLIDVPMPASSATVLGVREIATSLALTPGLYWLACVPQGGSPTFRTIGTASQPPVSPASIVGSTGTAESNCYYMTGVSGALPSWSGLNEGSQGYRVMVKAG